MPYELRNDLLRCIVYSNGEALMHQVEQLTRWIKEQKPDVSRLNGFLFELLGLAVGYAREQGYSGLDEYEQKYVSLDTIQSLFPVGRLNEWLTQAFRELWSLRSGRGRSIPSNPFIRQALKFMEENYHRNIGTVDIAEHVRLSRSYLSDLFSREMGESLAETLTRIRMEEAKKRLAAGTMKIYEIAEAVGFSDAKTFTRTFRRFVGCSPKEYEAKMKH
jgi:two-component system response regulator YesN